MVRRSPFSNSILQVFLTPLIEVTNTLLALTISPDERLTNVIVIGTLRSRSSSILAIFKTVAIRLILSENAGLLEKLKGHCLLLCQRSLLMLGV
jgi:hypothetical protein